MISIGPIMCDLAPKVLSVIIIAKFSAEINIYLMTTEAILNCFVANTPPPPCKFLGVSVPIWVLVSACEGFCCSVLPERRRGLRAESSGWAERAAGGRRGDGPERPTAAAGRWGNSGAAEKSRSAKIKGHK